MRGKLTLQVNRRLSTTSKDFRDKYNIDGRIVLLSFTKDGKKYMKGIAYDRSSGGSFFKKGVVRISRDELAFVKLVFRFFGSGNYCIKFWGKGKIKGLRVFWDGIIGDNKKFIRRKQASWRNLNPSFFQKESFATDDTTYIGRYMKTKQPGKWHNF